MDLTQMMADDASNRSMRVPTDEEISSIAELAERQQQIETKFDEQSVVDLLAQFDPGIPELEEALKRKKEELAKIREFDLPNALEACGTTQFKLRDGTTVSIKEDIYTGITEENKDGAFKWLEQSGNEGIIKNEVKCPFGKGQDAEARQLVEMLTANGISFTNSRNIHPQTLKAFVKRMMEDGVIVPVDLFSIHIKKSSIIKVPKKG